MAKIRIEFVPVKVAYLGWFGLDHLQLVYQPNDYDPRLNQDDWFVIEGLRDNTGPALLLGVEGYDGTTTLSDANYGKTGAELVSEIGTPASRGSVSIDVPDPENTWATLAEYAGDIASQELPYIAFGAPGWNFATLNSSSVIASLLYYIDVDIANQWPTGIRFSPGWTTLIGTSNDDELAIVNGFTALVGGTGSDTLEGGDGTGIEKLYGGRDDDTIKWSAGRDIYRGGQARLAYADDGTDTVDFSGVGRVIITGNPDYVENKTPSFFATHSKGVDKLFSIERLVWDTDSDVVVLDNGARLTSEGGVLNFGQQSSAGAGDTFDLSGEADGLLVNFAGASEIVVTRAAYEGQDAGLWLNSLEWLITTGEDDKVFTDAELRGLEAGAGNDLIDARQAAPFSGLSPQGFDIEIDGGDGNDTMVSGAGRTLMQGGDGADTFIVSTITPLGAPDGRIEIVINDAAADDRLLLPYNYFDGGSGGYDGSALMPVLGAIGKFSDMVNEGWTFDFTFQLESQSWYGTDFSQGVITFTGGINFELDGSDLLIRVYTGHTEERVIPIDDAGHTKTITLALTDETTETLVRVVDFQEGDLGIRFYDPGAESSVVLDDGTSAIHWENWDAATLAITNNGQFLAPLEARPEAPTQRPDNPSTLARQDGTDSADTISLTSAGVIAGGGGDDDLTGSSGADKLDGGTGADTMRGGGGNDRYVVDSAGDVIIEADGQGVDTISSSIDTTLGDNVENLTLTGTATSGIGNALDNQLTGNAGDNVLQGLDGHDVLAGDLGNDTLDGGAGADSYVYAPGDGDDVVIDSGAAGEIDRLELTGIDAAGVACYRLTSAPQDLLLVLSEGGSVVIRNQGAESAGIDEIAFDDGSTWSRAEIDARFAAASLTAHRPPRANDDSSILVASGDSVLTAAALLANDQGADGLTLTIVAVGNVSVGTASVTAGGDIALSLPAGTTGVLGLDYTVSDGAGGLATAHADITYVANAAPIATAQLPDASVAPGGTLALALPGGLFTDPDGGPLSISARLADGSALPAWLTFDAKTMAFAGTAPAGATGSLVIELAATDGFATASTNLTLRVEPQALTLTGTAGADTLQGGAGNDTLDGGAGNDTLLGKGGADSMTGGDGNDFYSVDSLADIIVEGSGTGSGTDFVAIGVSGYTLAANVENARLDAPAAGATGNELGNDITGNTLANTIDGAAGNDTLRGMAGQDSLAGGLGNDALYGGDDNDLLQGGDGNDMLDGGLGADNLDGGLGNDTYWVDNAGDVITDAGGTDTIYATATYTMTEGAAIETLSVAAGSGGFTLTGNSLDNVINGAALSDTLAGGLGNDRLDGKGGADAMLGGDGNDTYYVDNVGDTVIEAAGEGTSDTVYATTSWTLAGNQYVETLRVAGSIGLALTGNNLANSVNGGTGNDTLDGGGGDDILYGAGGADYFRFRDVFGSDRIADFQNGVDKIDLTPISNLGAFAELTFTQSGTSVIITGDAFNGSKITVLNQIVGNFSASNVLV